MTITHNETERAELIRHMVNRFLAWKLPKEFYPDSFISFDREKHDTWGGYPNSWPTGTNLFTAEQAKEMLEYLLEGYEPANPLQNGEQAELIRELNSYAAWCGGTAGILLRKAAALLSSDAKPVQDGELTVAIIAKASGVKMLTLMQRLLDAGHDVTANQPLSQEQIAALLAADKPAESGGEAVCETGLPRRKMHRWFRDVPVGTLLYTHPQPQPEAESGREALANTREGACTALLEAAHVFWKSEQAHGVHGAVKWVQYESGELVIFTRGEYKQQLMAAVGGTECEHRFPKAATNPQPQPVPDDVVKDAEMFNWMLEHIATGSIGFGDWWINADEPVSEWKSALRAAMLKEAK